MPVLPLTPVPASDAAPVAAPAPAAGRASDTALSRAEARGKQVLLYAPQGPLGGLFVCSRCGATALQPDLLQHRADCLYATGSLPRRP